MIAPPLAPPVWSPEELDRDRTVAIATFRDERLAESAQRLSLAHRDYMTRFEALFERTADLSRLSSAETALFADKGLLEALRYLGGPPISEDDLKVLADIPSLAPGRLIEDGSARQQIIDTVLAAIDHNRFPWLGEARSPTDSERNAAILASSALAAAQRVATDRRHRSKVDQEQAVKDRLAAHGFVEVRPQSVQSIAHAPAPGHFSSECLVGTRQADILLSTYDHRMVAIECKVSNSSTNSIKRLNNDAAVKAEHWRKDFGERHVVPVAVLSGVFKRLNLRQAQDRGLTLFWAHDLQPMIDWLLATKSAAS